MDSQQYWNDFHSLNSAFSDVMESSRSIWIEPSLVRLSYRGNKAASVTKTMRAIDDLLVEYAVSYPLAYIFTPSVLQSYCSIFIFLLQVRRAKSVLDRILLRDTVSNVGLRNELKVFYAVRGKLSWFVKYVLTFIVLSRLDISFQYDIRLPDNLCMCLDLATIGCSIGHRSYAHNYSRSKKPSME